MREGPDPVSISEIRKRKPEVTQSLAQVTQLVNGTVYLVSNSKIQVSFSLPGSHATFGCHWVGGQEEGKKKCAELGKLSGFPDHHPDSAQAPGGRVRGESGCPTWGAF